MLRIERFKFNMFSVNTYIVWDENTLESVIIDPGFISESDAQRVDSFIHDKQLKVKHLINTHLHFDHLFGNNHIENRYGVKAKAHPADLPWIKNIGKRIAMFGLSFSKGVNPILPENYLDESCTIDVGEYRFEIIHIPGHSPGSLVYYCSQADMLITGDVLFCGSLGRTDFADSNQESLIMGIVDRLFVLPPQTVVYPGHGNFTTIKAEKEKWHIEE